MAALTLGQLKRRWLLLDKSRTLSPSWLFWHSNLELAIKDASKQVEYITNINTFLQELYNWAGLQESGRAMQIQIDQASKHHGHKMGNPSLKGLCKVWIEIGLL